MSDLAPPRPQVQGWLDHNPDCYDNALYGEKRRWLGKNVEGAFYAVDRALHDWRARRDREGEGRRGRRGRGSGGASSTVKSAKSAK